MLLPLAPVSLIVQLFDAFLAFSLLFGSFLLYVQEGSAASIQVDMQIEAAARLKSTVSDLPALEISRNISFGAPRAYFEGEAYLGDILCVSLPFVSKPFLCVTHPRAIENAKYVRYFAIA